MAGSPKRLDADSTRQSPQVAYQVMYMAKRPSYEFVLAVPEDHHASLNADRALIQMRFKDQADPQDLVLNLEELEDFYTGLSQLIDYIRAEREKRYREL